MPWLTLLTFSPLAGAALLLAGGSLSEWWLKRFSLIVTLIPFIVSVGVFTAFQTDVHGMQFEECYSWIPAYGISYHLGVDGISLLLVVLTTFLTPITLLSAWTSIRHSVREFLFCLLFLETGMIGAFLASDVFLFYIFWEVMLIPMYFMIGMWGGPRRVYAAIKFVIFTAVGSLLMLVAILVLFFMTRDQFGQFSAALSDLYRLDIGPEQQIWLFLAFALAFAIKVPLFPFHTWLPDAHVEAPTPGSVILAGVLLKLGTYGYVRFAIPLFPYGAERLTPLMITLAVVGIIYGALVAMVQTDIKRLVAFSSVSHLGFVMLGLFAMNLEGFEGGLIQMVNHGLSTGALFLLVGMIYERRHTRTIAEFGGLAKVVPVFSTIFIIVVLSSIGLPGLNGFVGEFPILVGAFKANPLSGVLAATGVILAAVYLLWATQRMLFGKLTKPENEKLSDLNAREKLVLFPILVLIVWIGVYPKTFMEKIHTSANDFFTTVQERRLHYSTGAPEPRIYNAGSPEKIAIPDPEPAEGPRPSAALAKAGGM